MKIALVTKRISRNLGGAERVSFHLSRQLASEGHDVHVYTRYAEDDTGGARLHQVKSIEWLSPLRLLSFRNNAVKLLCRTDFDIVYGLCQVYPVDAYRVGDGVHAHWMRLRYPNPVVRGGKYLFSLVHAAMLHLERKIMTSGNCRVFITNSKLVRDQLVRYYGISGDAIHIIYNGVEAGTFNPEAKKFRSATRRSLAVPETDVVALLVANNWERKGLSTLIGALPRVREKGLRIVVAGRGNPRPFVRDAVRLGIDPGRIVFAGPTKQAEHFYGMADVFVLPSHYEPFSNACLEAMACGLPVITTLSNGASEIIREGENGFTLRNWDDREELSGALGRLLDGKARQKMGEAAVLTAREFTWDRHVEKTLDVFRSLREKDQAAG